MNSLRRIKKNPKVALKYINFDYYPLKKPTVAGNGGVQFRLKKKPIWGNCPMEYSMNNPILASMKNRKK